MVVPFYTGSKVIKFSTIHNVATFGLQFSASPSIEQNELFLENVRMHPHVLHKDIELLITRSEMVTLNQNS